MKIVIAYESKFGNGKMVVEHLGASLTELGHSVKIVSMRKAKPKSLPEADIYVFSSPTHVGNAPFKVRGFLKGLKFPEGNAKYALMATHMASTTKVPKTMDEYLKSTGLTKAADDLLIKVGSMKGPLEDDYKTKVEEFAAKLTKQ